MEESAYSWKEIGVSKRSKVPKARQQLAMTPITTMDFVNRRLLTGRRSHHTSTRRGADMRSIRFFAFFLVSLASFILVGGSKLRATANDEIIRLGDIENPYRGQDSFEADIICRDKGSRLPTARELAAYAKSRGACGIDEARQYKQFPTSAQCRDQDFVGILISLDGVRIDDQFNFSPSGYVSEGGDWNVPIWSQSGPPGNYSRYVFDGMYGTLSAVDASCGPFSFHCPNRDRVIFTRCLKK